MVSSPLISIEDLLNGSPSPVVVVPDSDTEEGTGGQVAPGSSSKGLIGGSSSGHIQEGTCCEAENKGVYTEFALLYNLLG